MNTQKLTAISNCIIESKSPCILVDGEEGVAAAAAAATNLIMRMPRSQAKPKKGLMSYDGKCKPTIWWSIERTGVLSRLTGSMVDNRDGTKVHKALDDPTRLIGFLMMQRH